MNKERRKQIQEAINQINEFKAAFDELPLDKLRSAFSTIESCKDEEEEYKDNIPESMQGGEKYEKADSAVDTLSEVYDSIETFLDAIDDLEDLNDIAEHLGEAAE